jgi:hypothetical protein
MNDAGYLEEWEVIAKNIGGNNWLARNLFREY